MSLTSPLHSIHKSLGATFTPFGNWDMPLKYGRELEEHTAVRTDAGVFDLSHMGEVRVTGADASAYLDYALLSTFSNTAIGQAKYTMITNESGGILDDLIGYRLGDSEYLLVPNAANTAVVVDALQARTEDFEVTVTDESRSTALIAVQGPRAEELVVALLDDAFRAQELRNLKYYRCLQASVVGVEALIARTGYTGEDGFELFVANEQAASVWEALAGAKNPPVPCGLAARDSLRLEAAMPLYGNELSTQITPVEAGMSRAFAKKEADFVGKDALVGREPSVEIVGLTSVGKRAGRTGAEIYRGEEAIGVITSGQPSPTLGHPIALAHVTPGSVEIGDEVEVDIRGKRYVFTIAERPFYSRKR